MPVCVCCVSLCKFSKYGISEIQFSLQNRKPCFLCILNNSRKFDTQEKRQDIQAWKIVDCYTWSNQKFPENVTVLNNHLESQKGSTMTTLDCCPLNMFILFHRHETEGTTTSLTKDANQSMWKSLRSIGNSVNKLWIMIKSGCRANMSFHTVSFKLFLNLIGF